MGDDTDLGFVVGFPYKNQTQDFHQGFEMGQLFSQLKEDRGRWINNHQYLCTPNRETIIQMAAYFKLDVDIVDATAVGWLEVTFRNIKPKPSRLSLVSS